MKTNHLNAMMEASLKNGGDIHCLPRSIQEQINYCNAFENAPHKKLKIDETSKPQKSNLTTSMNKQIYGA